MGTEVFHRELRFQKGNNVAVRYQRAGPATPEPVSVALTLAICTSFLFGGQIRQGPVGMPVMLGGVWSIRTVVAREAVNPAALVAVQVNVVPAVSRSSNTKSQPVAATIPDSGSVTLQLIVTVPRYQPLLPAFPLICGTIKGGVVSVIGGGLSWGLRTKP